MKSKFHKNERRGERERERGREHMNAMFEREDKRWKGRRGRKRIGGVPRGWHVGERRKKGSMCTHMVVGPNQAHQKNPRPHQRIAVPATLQHSI